MPSAERACTDLSVYKCAPYGERARSLPRCAYAGLPCGVPCGGELVPAFCGLCFGGLQLPCVAPAGAFGFGFWSATVGFGVVVLLGCVAVVGGFAGVELEGGASASDGFGGAGLAGCAVVSGGFAVAVSADCAVASVGFGGVVVTPCALIFSRTFIP